MSEVDHKTETLNLRVTPQFKATLQAAAKRERRSMANMVEFLVLSYCQDHALTQSTASESISQEVPHKEENE